MRILKLLGFMALTLLIVFAMGCGGEEEKESTQTQPETETVTLVVTDYTPTAEEVGTEVTCAVCGMTMLVTETMPAVTYDGKTYYFCNADEKAEFVAKPVDFIAKMESAVEETTEEVEGAAEKATGH